MHIKTGEYFACKVINKKLMEGREYMVRCIHLTATAPRPRCLKRHPMFILSRRFATRLLS